MIYKPARGSRLSDIQAQRYGERLEVLFEENDGIVTPDIVVDDARKEESPLHEYFDWDDAVAGDKWRKTQAGYLLRSIHVVIKRDDGEEEDTRFTYNVTVTEQDDDEEEPEERSVYVSVQTVLTDAEKRAQVIERAWKQLKSWQSRWQQYKEFSKVFAAISEIELA